MKSVIELRILQKTLLQIPLIKMLAEERYSFANFSPVKNIFEAYHVIIGRLHILDQESFQTLFDHGMEELYDHLSLMHNATSNVLQKEHHNDFHHYLESSIEDALQRCIPAFEDLTVGNTDKRTVLN